MWTLLGLVVRNGKERVGATPDGGAR